MKKYDKDYAIKEMGKMLKAKNIILRLKHRTMTELAEYLGIQTNALYDLYKKRMGKSWKEMMPVQVLVRKNSGIGKDRK